MGIKISSIDPKFILLEEILPVTDQVDVNWYNPEKKCFTNIRNMRILNDRPVEKVQALLDKNPQWRIVSVVSHEFTLNDLTRRLIDEGVVDGYEILQRQRICYEDGTPYIDEFGYYVYITFYVGADTDRDLRYEGYVKETELFKLSSV